MARRGGRRQIFTVALRAVGYAGNDAAESGVALTQRPGAQ